MKIVRLKLTGEESAQVTEVDGTFSEDDLALLRTYIGHMDRVQATGLIARGMPFITNMEWTSGSMMKITCPPFTDSELYELLHVLRPVILESEAGSYQKISALLGRRFQNKTFAEHQKYFRHMFEDGELSMYMQFSIGKQKILDDFLLRIWLNGTQYHTDKEKANAWHMLEASLTPDNARAIVISQLHSRVKALFALLHDVKLITKDALNNSFSAKSQTTFASNREMHRSSARI